MTNEALFTAIALFVGFAITFLVEAGIVFLFFRKIIPSKKIWLMVLLVNLFTWPLINAFSSKYDIILLLILEAVVCIVESIIYYLFFDKKIKKSIFASVIGNTISALVGNAVSASIIFILVWSLFA